ncbi:hypothetical protein FEM33_17605 [Dyadobacter flavalbus]|uniref:Uncharacterized protein n=1 Tax=Dyadobacter flavalbus TaxID=2579942 RepID=A0A5M8QVQ5_9BACT|nr:heparin lyase I family protein [Dyadobacter flavalbus]KAA6438503.1 hypothetical protein FEM33_17605 [Dyadobacter flavalbus]
MLAPVQAFDFRAETSTLNNNLSFSRESEASYYGSDGYLHFAKPGRNWLSQSQNLAVSPWVQVLAFVSTVSNIPAPDGSDTTCKVSEEYTPGEHRLSRSIQVPQGQPVTISLYLKEGTRSKVQISFSESASFTGGNPTIQFDLAAGTVMAASSNVIRYQAVSSGNGWWRVQLTAIPDLGSTTGFHIYMLNENGSISYEGSVDHYMYAWGAQVEPGMDMTAYTPTAEDAYLGLRYNYRLSDAAPVLAGALIEPESTNLVPYSQKLEGTPWRKQAASTPLATVKSPDGVTFGYKIKESTASSAHYIVPNPVIATEAGNVYTISAFFKAAERTWVYFNVSGLTIHYDVLNGILGNKSSIFIDAAIENAGNGWYRCAATFIASSSNTSTVIGCEISNGKQSYAGDGTSGVLIWGIQLEKAAAMTSYIRTNATAATRNADIVILNRPSASAASDIFTQRINGGNWIKQTSANYQIEQSENEIQIINFYDSDVISTEHEDIAVELFPENFVSVGSSGTMLSMFDKTFMIQTPNKQWSLQKAINKSSPLYRAQVNAGEVWSGDYTNKYRERSEFYMKNAQMPYDQDVWLSFAIKIEPGEALNLDPSDFCYLGQFHASEDEGDISSPPVLGFRLEGLDTIKAYTCSTTITPHTISPKAFLRASGQFTRGIWHKNVMRIRFSPTDGQFQWWKDGVELVNISGIGIGYPDAVGPYWKFGIYRSPMPQTVAVEYANMEVQYNTSLESRITDPLLIV